MASLATLAEEHFAIVQVHFLTRDTLLLEPSHDFLGQEIGTACFSMRAGRDQ
jgi:hypothetical protein